MKGTGDGRGQRERSPTSVDVAASLLTGDSFTYLMLALLAGGGVGVILLIP